MKYNRQEFLKLSGSALGAAFTWTSASSFINRDTPVDASLKLGLASYTFRAFTLDETIEMTRRMGLAGISLKSMHMPLESPAAEIRTLAKKVRDGGLDLYGAGVIYMKSAQEVQAAFDYALAAELKMIIGVPNHEFLPMVNEKVKQTGIRVAIHNHGPGDKLYSSPDDVHEKIKGLDPRIGFCIDIGHVRRIGQDPATMILKYRERLYDLHIKDVYKESTEDTAIEIGRGIIDIPAVLRALKEINYTGYLAFEYEKDEKDPLPGLAESVGYTRGVMKMI